MFLWYKATNFRGIGGDCRLATPTDFFQGHLGRETGLLSTQFRFRKWKTRIHNQWWPLVLVYCWYYKAHMCVDKNKNEKKKTTVKIPRGEFKLKHKKCNYTGHFAKYHNIFKVPTIWEYYSIFRSGHWWSLQSDWLSAVWFIHEPHYFCSKSHLSQTTLVMFYIVPFLLHIASFLFQIQNEM